MRAAQDYAPTTYWHPESTPEQRRRAQECIRQSYDLGTETKVRHAALRARFITRERCARPAAMIPPGPQPPRPRLI
jgi:hypothetical protein